MKYLRRIYSSAVGKYKQDKERAAFLTGAYIDVRDRKKTQAATKYLRRIL